MKLGEAIAGVFILIAAVILSIPAASGLRMVRFPIIP